MIAMPDLDHPVVRAVGWALVHFVWQGALVALVLAVALAAMPRRAARARYAAACAALGLMAAAPLATMIGVGAMEPPSSAADSVIVASAPAARGHNIVSNLDQGEVYSAEITAADASPTAAAPIETSVSWQDRVDRAMPWLVALWMGGAGLMALRLLGGLGRIGRMRRVAEPAPEEWRHRLAQMAERLGLRRPVEILMSARLDVPITLGWLRPAILLPAGMVTGVPAAHLEMILAHELAHIRRHDYLVNLVQAAVEAALFYHPAVWWVSARVREERECCCDDIAVALSGGDAAAYVGALAAMEERRLGPLALAATGGSLLGRARRLLGQDRGRDAEAATSARWMAGGALLLMLGLGGLLLPSQAREAAGTREQVPATTNMMMDEMDILDEMDNLDDDAESESREPAKSEETDESVDLTEGFGVALMTGSLRVSSDSNVVIVEGADGRPIEARLATHSKASFWMSHAATDDFEEVLRHAGKVNYSVAISMFYKKDMAMLLIHNLSEDGFRGARIEPRDDLWWVVVEAGSDFETALTMKDDLNRFGYITSGFYVEMEFDKPFRLSVPGGADMDQPDRLRESEASYNVDSKSGLSSDAHPTSPSLAIETTSAIFVERAPEKPEAAKAPKAPVAPKAPNAPAEPMRPVAPKAQPVPADQFDKELAKQLYDQLQEDLALLQQELAEWQQSPDWQNLHDELRALAERTPEFKAEMEQLRRDVEEIHKKMKDDPRVKEMVNKAMEEHKALMEKSREMAREYAEQAAKREALRESKMLDVRRERAAVDATEQKLAATSVTLEFNRAPVIDVLKHLAQNYELNMIFRERDVEGEVTMSVKDVPLGTALESLLKTNGLTYMIEPGGIIRVMPRM